ncbi:pyridoxal phosphate-dependent aminotransferase [Kiloniella sp.]|uniref:pyridoxal phosphate-dependent aminotransferase n=1 Tax=Kiloniella sp. TaxID=1938587 RepID=UPI003B0148B6
MTISRLASIPGIGVDKMGNAADAADAAGGNAEMLRLENLDTDIAPPPDAVEATLAAVSRDNANSYLPFLGIHDLRRAAAARVSDTTGINYDPETQCIVSAGGLSGILNVLLATLEPGDEVIITDPAYAGLLNRIRLAGGVPKLVPLQVIDSGWRMDLDALQNAASNRTRAVLTMSPSMPSGIVHTPEEWQAIADIVQRCDAWLIHDAAMERILYTDAPVFHPARLDGMAERTITIGSVSKEYRMIGWRVGWIVGPKKIMNDIGLVSLTNVVCQVGIAMPGAAAALLSSNDGVAEATAEWKKRRDFILEELSDLPVVRPDGGWSLLIDTAALGISPDIASKRLFDQGRIAATPMVGWGSETNAGRYLRFVFANEPVDRLHDIRERLRVSWSV